MTFFQILFALTASLIGVVAATESEKYFVPLLIFSLIGSILSLTQLLILFTDFLISPKSKTLRIKKSLHEFFYQNRSDEVLFRRKRYGKSIYCNPFINDSSFCEHESVFQLEKSSYFGCFNDVISKEILKKCLLGNKRENINSEDMGKIVWANELSKLLSFTESDNEKTLSFCTDFFSSLNYSKDETLNVLKYKSFREDNGITLAMTNDLNKMIENLNKGGGSMETQYVGLNSELELNFISYFLFTSKCFIQMDSNIKYENCHCKMNVIRGLFGEYHSKIKVKIQNELMLEIDKRFNKVIEHFRLIYYCMVVETIFEEDRLCCFVSNEKSNWVKKKLFYGTVNYYHCYSFESVYNEILFNGMNISSEKCFSDLNVFEGFISDSILKEKSKLSGEMDLLMEKIFGTDNFELFKEYFLKRPDLSKEYCETIKETILKNLNLKILTNGLKNKGFKNWKWKRLLSDISFFCELSGSTVLKGTDFKINPTMIAISTFKGKVQKAMTLPNESVEILKCEAYRKYEDSLNKPKEPPRFEQSEYTYKSLINSKRVNIGSDKNKEKSKFSTKKRFLAEVVKDKSAPVLTSTSFLTSGNNRGLSYKEIILKSSPARVLDSKELKKLLLKKFEIIKESSLSETNVKMNEDFSKLSMSAKEKRKEVRSKIISERNPTRRGKVKANSNSTNLKNVGFVKVKGEMKINLSQNRFIPLGKTKAANNTGPIKVSNYYDVLDPTKSEYKKEYTERTLVQCVDEVYRSVLKRFSKKALKKSYFIVSKTGQQDLKSDSKNIKNPGESAEKAIKEKGKECLIVSTEKPKETEKTSNSGSDNNSTNIKVEEPKEEKETKKHDTKILDKITFLTDKGLKYSYEGKTYTYGQISRIICKSGHSQSDLHSKLRDEGLEDKLENYLRDVEKNKADEIKNLRRKTQTGLEYFENVGDTSRLRDYHLD